MINIKREIVTKELIKELKSLLIKHKKEIPTSGTTLKLNEDVYIYADASDSYRIYICRDNENKVLGYAAFWIMEDYHNTNAIIANMDVIYVNKENRGNLFIGKKLIEYAEEDMKDLELDYILIQSPIITKLNIYLQRLGYEENAIVYKKEV